MKISIPKLSLVVLDRPQRVGQEHVRPQALPADRGAVVGRLPGDGQRRREQPGGHERGVRPAALRRRPAARPRAADRHRRHQRAARGPRPAGRPGPQVPLPAGRHRAESPRGGLSGAEPLPAGPHLRPARHPQPAVATAAVAPGPEAGRLPPRVRPRKRRGGRGGDGRAGAAVERPHRTTTARSTSSATFTAAPTNWSNCWSGWGTARSSSPNTGRAGATVAYAHPEGRKAVFVGDLVDRGPRVLDTLRHRPQHGGGRLGPVRAGQPRHEAAQEAQRPGRADHARPGRVAGRDRRPARTTCGPPSRSRWPSSSTGW